MGLRESRREHLAQLADEYRDESAASWLGGVLLVAILGGIFCGGLLYLLDWAFGREPDALRSVLTGVAAPVVYQCVGRVRGWRAHRRRMSRSDHISST